MLKWLVGGAAIGYGVSLLFHFVLLILFSIVVLNMRGGGNELSTELGIADVEGDEVLDTRAFEISTGSEGAEEPLPTVEPVPIDIPTPEMPVADAIAPEIEGVADGAGEDEITTPGAGSDQTFELPRGGNVVAKGSFTAWTIPEDPRPGQDYVIVVELKLPEGVKQYSRDDLGGQLVGTDGYKVSIPDGREWNGLGWKPPRRAPQFRRDRSNARIVFFVRGSQMALVRDTIQIRSRLLNEQQQLQIVF